MSRDERSGKRRGNGIHPGPREVAIPLAPARRILRLLNEKAAIERTLREAMEATLETLGCELEEVEEGIGWGIYDGAKPGMLVARYGPKGGPGVLDKDAILKAVREFLPPPPAPPPNPDAETPSTPN